MNAYVQMDLAAQYFYLVADYMLKEKLNHETCYSGILEAFLDAVRIHADQQVFDETKFLADVSHFMDCKARACRAAHPSPLDEAEFLEDIYSQPLPIRPSLELELLSQVEDRQFLREVLSGLSPQEREPLLLIMDGCSVEEADRRSPINVPALLGRLRGMALPLAC